MMGLRSVSSPTSVMRFRCGFCASASLTAATTSLGPKSPPIASTAIRPVDPGGISVGLPPGVDGPASDLDVEDLAPAVCPGLRIHPVGPEQATVGGVPGELRRDESVGCAPVCTTALGLFAFRIGHC